MIAAWSVASPYNGTPDELDHIIRAVGVVEGQVAPTPARAQRGSGAYQTVPKGLVRDNSCWVFNPQKPAACAAEPGSDSTPVVAPTGAGRYHPAYYALVGLPLRLWPGLPGLYLARLISAAAVAALLASAAMAILNRPQHRLMLGGLLVVLSPMVTHIAGAINPNGLDIAAGIGLFAGAIPLFRDPQERSKWLLALVGISAVLMASLRSTGPIFLCVGLAALAFPIARTRLVALWRWRAVRWWAVGIFVALVTSLLWILKMKTTDFGDFRGARTLTSSQALIIEGERWRQLVDEMVGVTSWLDTVMPASVYLTWEFIAGTLMVLAVLVGTWTDRWRLLVLLTGAVAIPTVLEIRNVNTTGMILQGRYMLPIMAGVALFAGRVVADRPGLIPARHGSLTRLFALVLLPIHLFCLAFTMARYQHGLPEFGRRGVTSLNPFGGEWQPPLGAVTALVIEVAGLVTFAVLIWRFTRAPQERGATPAGDALVADQSLTKDAADRPADVTVPAQRAPGDAEGDQTGGGKLPAGAPALG
jgi:hypothetical protein